MIIPDEIWYNRISLIIKQQKVKNIYYIGIQNKITFLKYSNIPGNKENNN